MKRGSKEFFSREKPSKKAKGERLDCFVDIEVVSEEELTAINLSLAEAEQTHLQSPQQQMQRFLHIPATRLNMVSAKLLFIFHFNLWHVVYLPRSEQTDVNEKNTSPLALQTLPDYLSSGLDLVFVCSSFLGL